MNDPATPGRPRRAQAGPDLHFLPLGGSGEIGMNLNLYEYGGKWLMVDLGVTFADDGVPGVEVTMPDPQFIVERRDDLVGLVLTHAHEDHLGAVPYLWPQLRCPIWATPFTAAFLRRKLVETDFGSSVEINVVPLGARFSVGPFDLEMVTLTHSIPEPNGLAIRTPAGAVFHTGDWKIDPEPLVGDVTDDARLRAIGDAGVLAMIGDSTNAMRDGESGSEAGVRAALTELFGRYQGRIAVGCFASNVARLESIASAAAAHGRDVALVGRSLWRIHDAAKETGYLADLPNFIDERDAGFIPRDKVVMICTGSQGEPRSALARIAEDAHPHVVLERGDVAIFSSRVIPGNERNILRMQNSLARLGVEMVTDHTHPAIHVSGHPARDELTRMYQWVRPRIAIPVHGEMQHMQAHAELARTCQVPHALVPENGTLIRLAAGGPEIVDRVHAGRLAAVGDRLLPVGGAVLKSRSRLMWNGAVIATIVLDRKGKLAATPKISAPGLLDPETDMDLAAEIVAAIEEGVGRAGRGAGDEQVEQAVRRTVREVMREHGEGRPVIDIHLVRI
ncbi:MAG TPA: ribonuclease J [Alphaproteobacteria bacterium]|nr:ribonuclease J [Alphaproteobacteria bacterium]